MSSTHSQSFSNSLSLAWSALTWPLLWTQAPRVILAPDPSLPAAQPPEMCQASRWDLSDPTSKSPGCTNAECRIQHQIGAGALDLSPLLSLRPRSHIGCYRAFIDDATVLL
ncbi:hypothetical protein FVEG_08949 [Fusarium verticillioides 7600]|uniref:Uncharacterized protein n=1 Tax=Gibberella moniliformis (strain M3125 / FGSC 7600) TaxID=334819 RepID=W7MD11_GIBM7|nr:hypothetical protein FVEG_08949 [Fusarium verticillioides 7600]EWG49403.1 hypothetical protein FVEG_08949 [Fusarium verticillioides 7600]